MDVYDLLPIDAGPVVREIATAAETSARPPVESPDR